MSIDTERLVLSEVHVGSSTLDEEEVVSRYTYLTPPLRRNTNTTSSTPSQDAEEGSNADDSGSDDGDSSSSGGESDEGSYSRVSRHRKRPRTSSRHRRPAHEVLTVVHRMATTLGLVGQQVWSAAFLLGDFVLTHEHLFAGMQVLELGAGPGVVGLVAARVAQRCYLTDYHQEVLKLLARNAEANRQLFAVGRTPTPVKASATSDDNGGGGVGDFAAEGGCVVAVRELDWFTFSREDGSAVAADCDPVEEGRDGHSEQEDYVEAVTGERKSSNDSDNDNDGGDDSGDDSDNDNGTCRPFSWRRDELEGLSTSASPGGGLVLVAADVIYDEGLTDALFHVLRMLMPVPVPRVPTERCSGDKVADGCSDDVTSAPKDSKCGRMVGQPPSVQSASSGDSCGFEAPTFGRKSASDERVFPGPEGKGQAVLYLALEKRFNFSMETLSVAATGYGALLRNVLDTTQQADSGGAGVDRSSRQGENAQKDFEGRRLPLSFQQCFRYTRNGAMELWEIRRRPETPPET